MTIGIIGCGNMGRALAEGIIKGKVVRPHDLLVADARQDVLQEAECRLRCRTGDNRTVAGASDILILAVKPSQVADVLTEVRGVLRRKTVLVSIAAGVRIRDIERMLGESKNPVIRVMPNLAVTVGAGIIAWSPGHSARGRGALMRWLFSPVGTVFSVPESRMDAVTAISGSGPGYLFYLAEIIEHICRRKGLPAKTARAVSSSLFIGAGRMLAATGEPAQALKDRVCSKGGTTAAGLAVLESRDLAGTMEAAIDAAERRSRELSGS